MELNVTKSGSRRRSAIERVASLSYTSQAATAWDSQTPELLVPDSEPIRQTEAERKNWRGVSIETMPSFHIATRLPRKKLTRAALRPIARGTWNM